MSENGLNMIDLVPNNGLDELEPNQPYLNHFPTWNDVLRGKEKKFGPDMMMKTHRFLPAPFQKDQI